MVKTQCRRGGRRVAGGFVAVRIEEDQQMIGTDRCVTLYINHEHARVQAMLEDAATVEKAARMIAELSGKSDAQSKNQLTRWVVNKEKHAQNIIATISDYFLTQRVKPTQKDYTERLVKHHAVILAGMRNGFSVPIRPARPFPADHPSARAGSAAD